MKVYVVTDNASSSDSDYCKVVGVFTDLMKAKRGILEYLDNLDTVLYSEEDIYNAEPYTQIEYYSRYDDYVFIYIEKLDLNKITEEL